MKNFEQIKLTIKAQLTEIKDDLKQGYYSDDKNISNKRNSETPLDILTKYDTLVSKKITDTLRKQFPDIKIISEEECDNDSFNNEDTFFLIDPIDGTRNFTKKIPIFFSGISLVKNKKTLMTFTVNPISDEMFFAEKAGGAYVNNRKLVPLTETAPKKLSIQLRTLDLINLERSFYLQSKIYALLKKQGVFQIEDHLCTHYELSNIACGRSNGGIFMGSEIWDNSQYLLIEEAGGVVTDWEGNPYTLENDKVIAAANEEVHSILLKTVKSICKDQ